MANRFRFERLLSLPAAAGKNFRSWAFGEGINNALRGYIVAGFNVPLNDTTNAFKAYRREVIAGCRPLISPISTSRSSCL
jgi:hypothetical protein